MRLAGALVANRAGPAAVLLEVKQEASEAEPVAFLVVRPGVVRRAEEGVLEEPASAEALPAEPVEAMPAELPAELVVAMLEGLRAELVVAPWGATRAASRSRSASATPVFLATRR